MTDQQKFIELYQAFGIELTAVPADKWDRQKYPECGATITLDEEHKQLSIGYAGFMSVVYFDIEGKFIAQGFWE